MLSGYIIVKGGRIMLENNNNKSIWRPIFQLMRIVQVLLRRLPRTSLNHQVLDEMGKLARFMEDLSMQFEDTSGIHQRTIIRQLCWQATRDFDFWVVTLREMNGSHESEISDLHCLTRSVREELREESMLCVMDENGSMKSSSANKANASGCKQKRS
jgi:hypothetical protein